LIMIHRYLRKISPSLTLSRLVLLVLRSLLVGRVASRLGDGGVDEAGSMMPWLVLLICSYDRKGSPSQQRTQFTADHLSADGFRLFPLSHPAFVPTAMGVETLLSVMRCNVWARLSVLFYRLWSVLPPSPPPHVINLRRTGF